MSREGVADIRNPEVVKIIYNTSYGEATGFRKRHTGIPLCSVPMVQNIVLPQIGLDQENHKTYLQGGHCVSETPYMEATVYNNIMFTLGALH